MQLCISGPTACLVDMETSVNDDPSDEEASRTGEKSFLSQLPGPTILCFIDTLINERQSKSLFGPMVAITEWIKENLNCCDPNVDNASRDARKEDKAKEALQRQKTPHKTQ